MRSGGAGLSGARGVERVSGHGGRGGRLVVELSGRGHGRHGSGAAGAVLVVVMVQSGVAVDHRVGRGHAADAHTTADAAVPARRRRLVRGVLDGSGQGGRAGRRERHGTGARAELLLVMVDGVRGVHAAGGRRDQRRRGRRRAARAARRRVVGRQAVVDGRRVEPAAGRDHGVQELVMVLLVVLGQHAVDDEL